MEKNEYILEIQVFISLHMAYVANSSELELVRG
jgi:hypothetical protein